MPLAKRLSSRFCIILDGFMAGFLSPFGLAPPPLRAYDIDKKQTLQMLYLQETSFNSTGREYGTLLCNTCVSKSQVRKRL